MRYRRRYYKKKSLYGKYKHSINAVLLCMGISFYMPKEWFSWNIFSFLKGSK